MQRYIARQPILDAKEGVHAFELLYRSSSENCFAPGTVPEVASARTVHDGLFAFGLDALVGDRRAFINVTRESLLAGLPRVMPPERTVVELLETVVIDAEVVAECQALTREGYRLALDDFEPQPHHEPIYELVDYIKVDFRLTQDRRARAALVERFAPRGIAMLAEKVETREEVAEAISDGYSYFQGFFFCCPEVLEQKDIPANKLGHLRVLQQVQRQELDLDALERVISEEVSLSVKLLRYLNSAALALRFEVTSIGHALRLLGVSNIRKWASALAVVGLGEGEPVVLVVATLVRARLCESLATGKLASRGGDLFLVGLLSTVDVLLRRPVSDVLGELPIARDIALAVLEGTGALGEVLRAVRAWERGRFDEAEAALACAGVESGHLAEQYGEAIAWAEALPV